MWAKGNLHTHTNRSDGDSEPSDVCRYYAERGYHFLSITDHNRYTEVDGLDSHGLIMIPGIELSLPPQEDPTLPLHVNGFGVPDIPVPENGPDRVQTLQNCIDAIVENGGIAQVNHPNFYFAFDDTVMSQLKGAYLLEVYNGHPLVYNDGDDEHIGVEEMWDRLLSAGNLFYGTGVDDAHHFSEFLPRRANPCRGWTWVRVARLTVDDVLSALRRGDFYASSGVELREVDGAGLTLRVVVNPSAGLRYVTRFTANNGILLQESDALDSSCALPSDPSCIYVRATVSASDGTRAWTQPVFRR